MGKTTSEVYDWTQNFWVGCQPVSAGCLHCYARADYQEFKRDNFDKVVRTKTWGNPLSWQRRLAKTGKVGKVFTCGWSDFFHPQADQWRPEAWSIIKNTPNLLWQVLTKRAELDCGPAAGRLGRRLSKRLSRGDRGNAKVSLAHGHSAQDPGQGALHDRRAAVGRLDARSRTTR